MGKNLSGEKINYYYHMEIFNILPDGSKVNFTKNYVSGGKASGATKLINSFYPRFVYCKLAGN